MVGESEHVSTNDRVNGESLRSDRERAGWADMRRGDSALAGPPELARALELVERIGDVPIPQAEIDAARERVRARVFAAIAAQARGDDAEEIAGACDTIASDGHLLLDISDTDLAAVRIPRRRDRPARSPRRALVVAAAVLVVGLTGLLAASNAAAALPGAPLYGLKRGEEWLAVRTAWSDTRQGEVLSQIARQRLAEAQAEAAAGNASEVSALTAQLDGTMRALISLTALMGRRHENTGAVAAALSQTLADERAALAHAVQQGQTVLVQSLTSAAQDQQQAMVAADLSSPSSPPTVVSRPGASSPNPSPQLTPTSSGSGPPISPVGPAQGQGSGQGLGVPAGPPAGGWSGSSGRGGNQGAGPTGQPTSGVFGTPTAAPTPTPMPGPYGPFGARRMM